MTYPAKRKQRSLADRFNEKWMPEPNSGCWLWTAYVVNEDSPNLTDHRPIIGLGARHEGNAVASRVAWMLYRGPIPDGLDVCHRCDIPICVNPGHLFLGTRAENMQDCVRKGRNAKTKPRLRGGLNRNARLTEAQVIAIRASDASRYELAAQYGVSLGAIDGIRKRRNWRHLQ